MKKVLVVEDHEIVQTMIKCVSEEFETLLLIPVDSISEAQNVINNEGASIKVILWDGQVKEGNTSDGLMQSAINSLPNTIHVGMSDHPTIRGIQKELCHMTTGKTDIPKLRNMFDLVSKMP